MPVLIDPANEKGIPDQNLDDGVDIEVPSDDVVLTRFISVDPHVADFQPEGTWMHEVVADVGRGRSVRIGVEDVGGRERSINIDDGLMVELTGTVSSIVGILPGRTPMSEDQINEHADLTGEPVPRFQQWDFRITRIRKTNGPEARRSLARSEDQKRMGAQTEMYDAFKSMFQSLNSNLVERGITEPTGDDIMKEAVKIAESGGNIKLTGEKDAI